MIMAFATENLNVIAYENGWTLWNYVRRDKLSDICSKDYFAAADDELKSGDMIFVVSKSACLSAGALLLITEVENNNVSTARLCFSAGKQ